MNKKKNKGGRFSLMWLVSIPALVFISILIFLLLWDGFERKVVEINVKRPNGIEIDASEILEPLTAEDYANLLGD